MKRDWQRWLEWPQWLQTTEPDPMEALPRIRLMERNLGLPVRAVALVVLFDYLFLSNWFGPLGLGLGLEGVTDILPREVLLDLFRPFFVGYVMLNVGYAFFLRSMEQVPHAWVQRIVFIVGWMDGLFFGGLIALTGGFDSVLYWVCLAFIVRNAVAIPDATRQIILNLFVTLCYVLAGLGDLMIQRWEIPLMDEKVLMALADLPPEGGTEPVVLRMVLLGLMTICAYGVQVLLYRQRRVDDEVREYVLRQQQLEATGRLAAEIAHQLKNPLAIINNAAFTLQQGARGDGAILPQVQMIREEVERSDRILTELMGYARLSEGQVERVNVAEALDQALEEAFPVAARYKIRIVREYAPAMPALLMQRSHLSEIFLNILLNAREAMGGEGTIRVATSYGGDYSIVIVIADDGPGIAPEWLGKIFEPYFTTKRKGTGLGLAIVKHNAELYGGKVEVQSELGKGTCFTIKLPGRTVMQIRK